MKSKKEPVGGGTVEELPAPVDADGGGCGGELEEVGGRDAVVGLVGEGLGGEGSREDV